MNVRGLVVFLVLGTSTAALPCSFSLVDLFRGRTTFEGQRVPRNAELRIFAFDIDVSELDVRLTRPDGTVVGIAVDQDDLSAFFVVDGLLDPGANVIRIDNGSEIRALAFDVTDQLDDEPPGTPVASGSHRTEGQLFNDPFSCFPREWPEGVVYINVDSDDAMAFASHDGEARGSGVTSGDGVINFQVFEDGGGDVSYDVVVRDFAGNVSDPTTVTVWAGCEGGCASSSALPLALSLLALLRRRRR